jgi:hypothetical protein
MVCSDYHFSSKFEPFHCLKVCSDYHFSLTFNPFFAISSAAVTSKICSLVKSVLLHKRIYHITVLVLLARHMKTNFIQKMSKTQVFFIAFKFYHIGDVKKYHYMTHLVSEIPKRGQNCYPQSLPICANVSV